MGLSAILTRAKGVDAAGPAIVNIHGGPASLAQHEYAHGFQFLANRGYSVLSVKFRGSAGYGKAFQAVWFRAFGRAMQDDIVDATQWLVEQTERFVQAAQDAGKDIETLYFDDEGHWDYHWTNNVIRTRRVEDFLAKHLGGRSGGWDMIEPALPYLKGSTTAPLQHHLW